MELPRLILASKSPRRVQIIESIGFSCDIIEPNCHEIEEHEDGAKKVVLINAEAKAQSVLERAYDPTMIVVAADTTVSIKDRILGKPENREQAIEFLKLLSGKKHTVLTGLCLVSKKKESQCAFETTEVKFRKLKKDEILKYAQTREPYDKAGSYGVQGMGSLFIESIKGSYTNVMGLPVELFLKELEDFTGIEAYEWFQ